MVAAYENELHAALRQELAAFARAHVAPLVERAEREAWTPVELFPLFGRHGYLCMTVSPDYGGAGGDTRMAAIFAEEIGKVSAGIASALGVHSGIGTLPIATAGTPEQKRCWLPSAVAGEKIHAFGLTEPNVGSDAMHVEATARRSGGGYVLKGTKIWITNGAIADRVMVTARLMDDGQDRGITLFVVEKGMAGFHVGQQMHKLGHRSSITSELILDDVTVPVEKRLGAEGQGMDALKDTLTYGRIIVGARSVGVASAAMAYALQYARERVQFGKPIGKHQSVRNRLVDMHTEIESARHLVYHAAWLRDEGHEHAAAAALAKYYASEMSVRVTNSALQVLGAVGYSTDAPVERFLRDARLHTIVEGTSEIQQHIIGRALGL